VRGTAVEVAARFDEPPKGEITLVIGAAEEVGSADPDEAVAAVAELVAAGVPRRQAADVVARLARLSRNTLYSESLKSR
jgi:16S rRNA (cytidine1402-2'-O)-methyltransferase